MQRRLAPTECFDRTALRRDAKPSWVTCIREAEQRRKAMVCRRRVRKGGDTDRGQSDFGSRHSSMPCGTSQTKTVGSREGWSAQCKLAVTTLAVAVMHDVLRIPCGPRHVRRVECEPRAQCMGRHAADDPPWPSVQWKGAKKVVRCGLDEREVPPVVSGGLGQRWPPRWP